MNTAKPVWRPSPNFNDRPAGQVADHLILHYTGMVSGPAALERLTDAAAKVSSHYLVEEDGTVFQMVEEGKRAWHAGVSAWRDATDLNSRSIGIEIVNPGHRWGYRPFPPAQMQAVIALAQAILGRHPIPPDHVIGHSDIGPARKEDPGELFDWEALAEAGVGLMPPGDLAFPPLLEAGACCLGDTDAAVATLQDDLRRWGYACPTTGAFDAHTLCVVRAFQRHWRRARIDGMFDPECRARLDWLLASRDLA